MKLEIVFAVVVFSVVDWENMACLCGWNMLSFLSKAFGFNGTL